VFEMGAAVDPVPAGGDALASPPGVCLVPLHAPTINVSTTAEAEAYRFVVR
jgi:hypothetical protein